MERSDERLSTRDIASPSGADTDTERDPAMADAPAADTAAVPPERTDRDVDDDAGAVAAERAEPVGDGDVVTDEPTAGRGPSRESIADADTGRTDGDDGGATTPPAPSAPAPAAAAAAGDTATGTQSTGGTDRSAARDSSTSGDAAPLL